MGLEQGEVCNRHRHLQLRICHLYFYLPSTERRVVLLRLCAGRAYERRDMGSLMQARQPMFDIGIIVSTTTVLAFARGGLRRWVCRARTTLGKSSRLL